MHRDQMVTYNDAMSKGLAETRSQLERLSEEIATSIEKIGSREKYLNTQLDSLMTEYRFLALFICFLPFYTGIFSQVQIPISEDSNFKKQLRCCRSVIDQILSWKFFNKLLL